MLKKLSVTLVACLLLCACVGPQIYHTQLWSLNLGMSPEAAVQKLGQPPLSMHNVRVDDKGYVFYRYTMNNGIDHGMYLLAFEANSLKYWGYIDDFRRHPDSRLNRAIDAVLPAIPR